MDNTLLCDIDGVVTDWCYGFILFLVSKGFDCKGSKPSEYSMTDIFPMLTQGQFSVLVDEFQASEAYGQLTLYPDVVDTLKTLYKLGINIEFVTACGETDHIRKCREKLLSPLEGLYRKLHILPIGDDKSTVFKRFKNSESVYIVDDQSKILNEAAWHNIKGILKTMSHNIWDQGYNRISKFSELPSLIRTALPQKN